jgi:hypothetical protein
MATKVVDAYSDYLMTMLQTLMQTIESHVVPGTRYVVDMTDVKIVLIVLVQQQEFINTIQSIQTVAVQHDQSVLASSSMDLSYTTTVDGVNQTTRAVAGLIRTNDGEHDIVMDDDDDVMIDEGASNGNRLLMDVVTCTCNICQMCHTAKMMSYDQIRATMAYHPSLLRMLSTVSAM